jgi:hypothetical protein
MFIHAPSGDDGTAPQGRCGKPAIGLGIAADVTGAAMADDGGRAFTIDDEEAAMLNEPFAEECDALLQHVPDVRTTADEYPSLSTEARIDAVADVLDFLDYHLAPRIIAEQRTLFPLLTRALHAPCDVETLVRHHATIGELTRALRQAEPDDAGHVQDVLRALADVVETHLGAEREIVLPQLRVH